MTIAIGIYIIGNITSAMYDMDMDVIEEEWEDSEPINLLIFVIPLALLFMVVLVLSLMTVKRSHSVNSMTQEIEDIKKKISTLKTKIAKEHNLPTIIGNFHFSGLYNIDNAMEKARTYRDVGYRVKLKNFLDEDNVYITDDNICGVYVSDWPKDEEIDKGEPKWMDN